MVSAERAMEWAAKVMVPIPETREAKTICPRQLVVLVAAAGMAMEKASFMIFFCFSLSLSSLLNLIFSFFKAKTSIKTPPREKEMNVAQAAPTTPFLRV